MLAPRRAPPPVDWSALIDALADGNELYAVQAGQLMGCKPEAARARMESLERDGVLVSRFARSPISGLGRRYYRLRDEATSAA